MIERMNALASASIKVMAIGANVLPSTPWKVSKGMNTRKMIAWPYSKRKISFFGTTRRGFVYKFDCEVSGEAALQVFIANADLENPQGAPQSIEASATLDDRAVSLVRAMFEQRRVAGFEISDAARAPVNVGDLKVQLVSEYRSPAMTGKVLRIENNGSEPMTLKEEIIAGDGAIAVSISNPNLASGQATAAYVVVPSGG
ncbi:MAG: hypothetical protein B7Y31_00395 [Novosphingobium sp. 16-62-11]|nr:MAG: hypothetical protein B7Y31_00395 [Novosphingobium sp. 16-62-11]